MTATIPRSLLALGAALALASSSAAQAPRSARTIDPRAEEILRAMATFLAGTPRFGLEAEETFDVEVAGTYRVQLGNVRTLTVERPSRFVADATGDTLHRSSWFDGRTLTVLNRQRNVYASLEAPGTIDAVLDKLAEEYEVVLPLSDLLYSDPYPTLMEGVLFGKYLGIHQVAGRPCHHLTFGQEGFHWQIWIDSGEKPWPRKISIAQGDDPGVPRYEATFKRWIADPPRLDAQFQFKPPAGARRVPPSELAGGSAASAGSSAVP